MRSMMLCIVACFLALSAIAAEAKESCTVCHRLAVKGVHAALPCLSCHLDEGNTLADPAALAERGRGCVGCHRGFDRLFDHAMATRKGERDFAARSFGRMDAAFFGTNCNGCHLNGCTDCHGGKGHELAKPRDRECFACHKGYFIGTDYYGMAPREDSLRYQRGDTAYGETYLKMTPDVHAEAGLACADCHSMASLAAGGKASKRCTDCHEPKQTVVEHRIAAHLEKMECWACHSAWGAQEYGTFYLRFANSKAQDEYRVRRDNAGDGYVKSAYLRKQDAPPLGLNARGKVSPIRPQFIGYYTDAANDRVSGEENLLVAAEWKAFFPHTIRRGTVMCEGCHDAPRRFLQEEERDRIYQLQADGMKLPSFWAATGQRVTNGEFFTVERYRRLATKSPAYRKAYLEKWQKLVNRVEASSAQR